MNTPIVDFVKRYADSYTARFHMPGHKGRAFLGCEPLDLTEIEGADLLSAPEGIIAQSEANATALFETAHTFYSTQGSTLAIQAMVALASRPEREGTRPLILAARNVHKSFIHACALLDVDVEWLLSEKDGHFCSCSISPQAAEKALLACPQKPRALWLTSPDYLGHIADVAEIAEVCHKHGVLLLVDNAHGAYLHFLSPSLHPIDRGADLCCDSAHKTLPALTGAAYLHVSKNAPAELLSSVRAALSLFASTSPSYLILQSLDLCNRYLDDCYEKRLAHFVHKLDVYKCRLLDADVPLLPSEPLKLVISPLSLGYTGEELGSLLRSVGAEPEFCDHSHTVLMLTPENTDEELSTLWEFLSRLPKRIPLPLQIPALHQLPTRACSIRRAILSRHELLPVRKAVGRVCAAPTVSCPPAVPIVMSGELITSETVELLLYYRIDHVEVVAEPV